MGWHRAASLLATVASLVCGGFVARVESAPPLERVVVQLKWWHQYQFAGYYAAQLRGFYRDEGLEVELLEGTPGRAPLRMVLDGRADFAISDTEVLLARMSGQPVVAIATIFQHSPYVLMTRRDSGIMRPSDLVGKRVMLAGDRNEAQFFAMLAREGVRRDTITVVRHSWRVDDLIARRVDAMSAYSTVEVADMRSLGVEPGMIRASDYGIDFYGDTLFTSEAVVARDPGRVTAFRRATIRGWEYALGHVDEIAAHIRSLPTGAPERPSLARLVAEAAEMRRLVLPDVVEVGRINPGRFERMAQTFQEVGLHTGPYSLDGFVFGPDAPQEDRWRRYALGALAAASTIGLGALVWIRQLRRAVRRRTAQLASEVSERRAAESELRASEHRFRHIVEHMPALLDAVDDHGHFVFWNRECERVTGYTAAEIVGNPDALAWLYPDDAERARVVASRATPVESIEWTLQAKDGQPRHILWRSLSEVVRIPGWSHWSIGIDLTAIRQMEDERARYEERLRQAQRLESLGLLAGGIAHDFNNLLTGMLGHAELAEADLADLPRAAENVRLIERAARQAADLTRQLLAYSGRGRLVVEPLDLSRVVREMAQLLELTVSHRARLTIASAASLPAVDADATQIRQILMNLILNAAEAIGPGGGDIHVSTQVVDVGAEQAVRNVAGDPIAAGRYVAIAVHDTGCGMAAEVRSRIFDPFYSTKFQGRGLGLAAVVGIVRSHHGALFVESAPDAGSRFTVLLPPSARAAAPADRDQRAGTRGWTSSGQVLVIDDEPAVRDLAQRMLMRLGFTAVLAVDGVDGLARLDDLPAGVRLVLLDLTMPRMNGEETLQALRRRGLSVPVILASGYHEHDMSGRVGGLGPVTFLHKPFTFRQLQDAIRGQLEPPDADPA